MDDDTTVLEQDEDDWDAWHCCKCSKSWVFEGSGPEEDGMKYCPACGRRVVEYARDEEEG